MVHLPPSKPGFQYRFGFVDMYKPEGCRMALAAMGTAALRLDGHERPLYIERCLLHAKESRQMSHGRQPNANAEESRPVNERRYEQTNGHYPRAPQLVTENGFVEEKGRGQENRGPGENRQKKTRMQAFDFKRALQPRRHLFSHLAVFYQPQICRYVDFPLDELLPVSVSLMTVESPSDFYILLDGNFNDLAELGAEMAQHYANWQGPPMQGVQENELVVLTRDEKTYSRLLVTKGGEGEDTVQGFLVDHAGITTATLSQLRPINVHFAHVPMQAIGCSLYGVHSPSSVWPEQATAALTKMLMDNGVETFVRQISFAGLRSRVQLFVKKDENSTELIDCAEELEQQGWCSYEKPHERIVYSRDVLRTLNLSQSMGSIPKLQITDIMKKTKLV